MFPFQVLKNYRKCAVGFEERDLSEAGKGSHLLDLSASQNSLGGVSR